MAHELVNTITLLLFFYLFKKHRTGPVLFCVNMYMLVVHEWIKLNICMRAAVTWFQAPLPLYFMIWSSELPTASAYSVSTWHGHRNSNKGRVGMQDLASSHWFHKITRLGRNKNYNSKKEEKAYNMGWIFMVYTYAAHLHLNLLSCLVGEPEVKHQFSVSRANSER